MWAIEATAPNLFQKGRPKSRLYVDDAWTTMYLTIIVLDKELTIRRQGATQLRRLKGTSMEFNAFQMLNQTHKHECHILTQQYNAKTIRKTRSTHLTEYKHNTKQKNRLK